ncbi:MAG: hypothetical protein AB1465_03785 [Patescibacteria group bacterium]
MTPEEKFNQDVWWILQEIKKDELLTPKGEKVEFLIRSLSLPKNRNTKRKDATYNFPQEETQRRLLKKLKEWEAIDDFKMVADMMRGSDIFNPTIYQFSIKQPKFNELYQKYEDIHNYQLYGNLETKGTSEHLIMNCIISGLFRDEKFHNFNDKSGKEFYIDILDELLANNIKLNFLLKRTINNNLILEIVKIIKPEITKAKNKIKELEKNKWIKIKKINNEVFQKGWDNETLYKGKLYSSGKLLTHIIKIDAKEINWGKFIEYIANEYEKVNLDWDNIYSLEKQKSLLIQKIYERNKFLDKDTDIIFLLDKHSSSDFGRIQILKTLQELERENFIHIVGFQIYDPENYIIKIAKTLANIKDYPYLSLRAKISITKKFKERIKKINDDFLKSLKTTNKPIIKTLPNISIKNAQLDEKNYILEINNGEKILSFKSKKKGVGLEKETKQFKILYHLWDFRWELKDNKVIKRGDFVSLDNLVKNCGSKSNEAAYKHIQRLNNRFQKEGIAIEIKGENEKYRLIINKT